MHFPKISLTVTAAKQFKEVFKKGNEKQALFTSSLSPVGF